MNYATFLEKNKIFAQISESAESLGLETYVIGGFVRDIFLKRPSKDIDVVCVGSGIKLAREVAKRLGDAKVTVFKNFGTAMINAGEWEVEFVGARRESYNRDSRKPIVEDGTLQDDQNRRDFTINAMALSLNKENFGDLIDPFDGMEDLRDMTMKTPLDPGITFSDDPLRMMRAIRFASQLSFDIEPDTFAAISENTHRIRIVSKERIADELNKIILSKTPSYGFKLLFHSGLLKEIFPEMTNLHGVEVRNGKRHKDNFFHTLQVLDNVSEVSDDLWLRWAAILHDIAKPQTKRFHPKAGWTFHGHEDLGGRMVPKIFRKMKLPLNDNMKFVQKLVRLHLRPIALVKETITDSALRRLLFEAGDDLESLMKLCRADITSKNDKKVKQYLSNFDEVERKLEDVEARDQVRNFQPPVTGEQIMEFFDLKPSRTVGEIKDAIKDAVLEGRIRNDHEEAWALMKELGLEKGLTPKSE
ncbi:tRNA nucleotidyltransferase [Fulvitalea axinellae]|uniref:tRNA nucleotidyltransferase n=1 Tax=Fulvitalea axinellae TaxID=1182444 RepID=A0AAU9D5H2_9BACT|nr:tRNA nucleotidyltransferase [Fulvitalea axinellae]